MSLILLLITSIFSLLPNVEVEHLRKLHQKAIYDKAQTQLLIAYIESCKPDNLSLGYKGSGLMIMAKHSLNPYHKLNYFNAGKKLLEEAIKNDPENPELRYLRLAIQVNIPSFLNYTSDIKSDVDFLVKYVLSAKSTSDKELRKNIVGFLKKSEVVSEADKINILD
jgi:hypothetical protein